MKIGIIGAGGWGTAVSNIFSQNGHSSVLWCFEQETADDININRRNSVFLPNCEISEHVSASTDIEDLSDSDYLVIATPTQFIRQTIRGHEQLFKDKNVINLAKGIEKDTLLRVSQILESELNIEPENYIVLTGPSHAEEVVNLTPTTIVAASVNHQLAVQVQKLFSTQTFRIYSSIDVIGCELGGALKNVIAIAAGVIDGLNLGDNAKAALITRGLAEMARLGVTLGALQMTFFGLSGLGDLYVTCASKLSRNRYVGEQIGRGRKLNDIIGEMKMVAEGVQTCRSAYQLTQKHDVEMPIIDSMYKVLFEDLNAKEATMMLMNRKSNQEWWG